MTQQKTHSEVSLLLKEAGILIGEDSVRGVFEGFAAVSKCPAAGQGLK